MYPNRIIAGLLTLGLFFTSGCWGIGMEKGNGDMQEESRTVEDFDSVEVHAGLNLSLEDGSSTSVEVEIDSNLMEMVETVVEGSTLIIRPVQGKFGLRPSKGSVIRVTAPEVESIAASGGADATVELNESSNVEMRASGGSDINARVDVNELSLNASGGSDIDIEGESKSIDATASGGSDVNARKLEAESASGNASGGSDVKFGSVETVEGSASGGSGICYEGDPDATNVSTSGGSSAGNCK